MGVGGLDGSGRGKLKLETGLQEGEEEGVDGERERSERKME